MSDWYMKKPCAQCPFRRDVRPFLHVKRAEEIAYLTENSFNDFPCHKTISHDEDEDGESFTYATNASKTCAGWLAMSINEGAQVEPEGWRWPGDVYCDASEMIAEYEAEANGEWTPPARVSA